MKSHSNSHSLFCFRSTHAENCPLNFTTFSFIYLTGPIDTQFSLAHPHARTHTHTHTHTHTNGQTHALSLTLWAFNFSPIASLFVSGKRRRPPWQWPPPCRVRAIDSVTFLFCKKSSNFPLDLCSAKGLSESISSSSLRMSHHRFRPNFGNRTTASI